MTTLEKIRSEIEETQKNTIDWSRSAGLIDALYIIDKYAEQEPQCTEHPCLGTLCRYYKEPCDECNYKAFTELYFHTDPEMVEQEPMREFTEEEAKAYSKALDKMYKPTGFNVFNEPCDDVISREDALEALNTINGTAELDKAFEVIEKLPPVRPKEQTGHWIKSRDCYGNHHFTCSECGNDIATQYADKWEDKYCSECGARMFEPQESEDRE